MQKNTKILLVFLALSCMIVFPAFLPDLFNKDAHSFIEIINAQENPFNMEQHSASIKMGVSDQQLCLLNDNTLYFLANQHLQKIADSNATIISLERDYIYYMVITPEYACDVYCYYIPDGTRTYLFTTTDLIKVRDCYLHDGAVFIPLNRNCSYYYSIYGNQINETNVENRQWKIHGNTYTFMYKSDQQELICYRDDGSMQSLEDELPYGFKTVVECNNGLLIHNEGQGDLLYFIEGDTGKIVELFTVECMTSVSAVNVYQSNVYISFCRFEKHGQLGMVGYESDTLEGTYCISLSDYSVNKLSNNVYDGLYIFDESGIYACDAECNVYKLDFDGNVIIKLRESK